MRQKSGVSGYPPFPICGAQSGCAVRAAPSDCICFGLFRTVLFPNVFPNLGSAADVDPCRVAIARPIAPWVTLWSSAGTRGMPVSTSFSAIAECPAGTDRSALDRPRHQNSASTTTVIRRSTVPGRTAWEAQRPRPHGIVRSHCVRLRVSKLRQRLRARNRSLAGSYRREVCAARLSDAPNCQDCNQSASCGEYDQRCS